GLDAASLTDKQLDWAQNHVAILSGLYGVLRPLDLMQPYRLEMGTRLVTKQGETLYDYWGSSIAQYLNARMGEQGETVLLNLASEEYFKSVDRKALTVDVVQCVFQDYKNGVWKVISFYAKRARGLMARYVIEKRIKKPAALQAFASEGYGYAAEVSTPNKLVFRRRAE
ncbi:MAG: peroxide stress protein YaaA, partial [Paralcaligenes sp.]